MSGLVLPSGQDEVWMCGGNAVEAQVRKQEDACFRRVVDKEGEENKTWMLFGFGGKREVEVGCGG